MSIGEEKRGMQGYEEQRKKCELRVVQIQTPTSPQIFYLPLHFPYFPMLPILPIFPMLSYTYIHLIPFKHTYSLIIPFTYISFSFLSNFLCKTPKEKFSVQIFQQDISCQKLLKNHFTFLYKPPDEQLTKSPACDKIVSYLHILSNVTIRRKRVDKQGSMW